MTSPCWVPLLGVSGFLLVASGCSLDTNALTPGARDASFVDAALVDGSGMRDASMRDAAMADGAPTLDADVDAGPRRPTSIVTTANAGGQGSQPAVIWDGSTFMIGLIADDRVELLRMSPGRAVAVAEEVITAGGVGLQDVLLATEAGKLAVGWTEDRGGDASLMVRVLPADAAPRVVRGGLFREDDRQDAALYATGGGFGAVVRDETTPGNQRLQYADLSRSAPIFMTATVGSLGELDIHATSLGPLLAVGRPSALFRRESGAWVLAAAPILGEGSEGSVAALADGTVASVWLHADIATGGRILSFMRHNPGPFWAQVGATVPLDIAGSDPALAPFDGGVLMAFAYADTVGRTLGLAALDVDGNVVAGPCRVPSIAENANDPDLACAAGWCAIAWMEASAYDATDYVTRVMQVPEDPDNLCP